MDKRKQVLLVDDVRLFLELEKSFFNRDQVKVTVARDGAEALRTLRVLRPQLVIMDLRMPTLDGDEACRRIKDDPELFTVPVILTAAADNQTDWARCRAAGCEAVVGKPLNRQELLGAARKYLKLAERSTPRVATRMLVHYGVEDQQTLHDFSVNLAAGGVFLETPRILPIGTPLTLEFFIPGAAETVCCKGRVAWVNAPGGRTKPDLPGGIGVQFVGLDATDAQAIREFIHTECRPSSRS